MRYALETATAALVLTIAGSAFAACPDDINKLRADLQKNESFNQRYTAGKIDRGSYMRLFDAAQTFASMGLDRRCEEVLAGIRELSEKAEAEAPKAPPPAARPDTTRPTIPNQTDQRTTDRTPPADTHRSDTDTARKERLHAAQPINAVKASFENLVGADVRNTNNDRLGDVDDLIMEHGQVTAVIIARGGFLGMGVNHHIIPASQVKVADLSDNHANKKNRVAVLDLSDEQVKALPQVKKENGAWVPVADSGRSSTPSTPPERAPSAPPTQNRPRQ